MKLVEKYSSFSFLSIFLRLKPFSICLHTAILRLVAKHGCYCWSPVEMLLHEWDDNPAKGLRWALLLTAIRRFKYGKDASQELLRNLIGYPYLFDKGHMTALEPIKDWSTDEIWEKVLKLKKIRGLQIKRISQRSDWKSNSLHQETSGRLETKRKTWVIGLPDQP